MKIHSEGRLESENLTTNYGQEQAVNTVGQDTYFIQKFVAHGAEYWTRVELRTKTSSRV